MLYYNTVNHLLRDSLVHIMAAKEFSMFRLVGGTALSLRIGHRQSVDIDLFSDIEYGTIDFDVLTKYLEVNFPYVDHLSMQPAIVEDTIRMATLEEIIAMKVDVVQRGGRKKDFWDLHALFDSYNMEQMLQLHEKRYPYSHVKELILQNFTDFTEADNDFDPICLMGKYWEFIKEDIEGIVSSYIRSGKL